MSLAKLNRWIKKEYPEVELELWRVPGENAGYFAWDGASVYNPYGFEFDSIYVFFFNQAEYSWWQDQVRGQIEDFLKAKAEYAAEAAGEFPIAE